MSGHIYPPMPLPLNEHLLNIKKELEDGIIDIKLETEVDISDMEFEDEDEEDSQSQDNGNDEIYDKSAPELHTGTTIHETFGFLKENQLENDSQSVQPLPSRQRPSNHSKIYEKLIRINSFTNTCKVCSFEHQSIDFMRTHCKQHILMQLDQGSKCSYIKCHLCERKYKHLHHFYKHLNSLHKKKYNFSCEKCNKTFVSRDTLNVHIKYLHKVSSREKRDNYHVCSICMRKFQREHSLQRHMVEVHEGLKYTCDLCNKQFTQKESVRKHLFSVHFKSNNFPCVSCGKNFTVKSSLSRHIERKHTKKYFCNYCMKGFERKPMLKNHFKQSHKTLFP